MLKNKITAVLLFCLCRYWYSLIPKLHQRNLSGWAYV